MKRRIYASLALLLLASPFFGQEPPLLDLETCLRELLGAGSGIAALERGRTAARSQLELAAAKLAPSLSAGAVLLGKEGFGDSAALSAAASGAASGLGGEASGSLGLSTPSTALDFSASRTLPSAESSSSPTTKLGLNLSQALRQSYPGGAAKAAYEKSLLAYQSKELQAGQERAKALFAAKKAYVALLGAQRARELAAAVLERQNRLLAQARALRGLGEATELELRSAELGAREKALNLEEAELGLRTARRSLALLIGRPADSQFRAADLPEPRFPAASREEALEKGLGRRGASSDLALQRRAAELDLALARGQAEPSLSLKAGVSLAFRGGDSPSQDGQANASLVLGLPLLDGGALAAQAALSGFLLEGFRASEAELRLSIASEIEAAYDGAQILRSRSALSADQAALAEAKLALVEAQLGFGAASLDDILDAQDELATAQAATLKAGNDYLLAVFALETAMGLEEPRYE